MPIVRSVVLFVLTALVLLGISLIHRAYIVNQPCLHDIKPLPYYSRLKLAREQINRLRKSITFETVSFGVGNQNRAELQKFIDFVRHEFADIEKHKWVELSLINELSMLYKIQGTEKHLKPYMLCSHSDVVPAQYQSGQWTHPPFSGHLDTHGYVYGRGTLDDKVAMLAHLEALRHYISIHGQPKRTIYLAYGHDEELAGHEGAARIAEHLVKQNVSLEYVLDEGTMIIEEFLRGLKPIALISIAEKGYLTVRYSVNTTGGHSSMPTKETSAIAILGEAVSRLHKKPVPSMLGHGPEKLMLERIATQVEFFKRVALSNLWLFKPIVEYILSKRGPTDALQRTSTAVTMFTSGEKENVLSSYGEFIVNHRIHTKQSCLDIVKHDLDTMNDRRIQYNILNCIEPSSVSPVDSRAYRLIEHTTMQIYSDVTPIPGVMIALSDSRYYHRLTQNIYKYKPVKITNTDLKRYHGVDERISINGYQDMINFYFQLFKNTDELDQSERINRVEL